MFAILAHKLNLGVSKCWSFLRPRRKLGLISFVILSAFVITIWFAGTSTTQAFWDTVVNGIAGLILVVAGWMIKLTFFILEFIIEVAGYNGFIDSPAVTVGWVMVRDVTNMFFVVVLLLISFGTILGLEQYEYKKLLIKLLMAAVIVNFSRIICGIIIDVAQVVMITFVNGIAATAAGNLVNMFKIGEIMKLTDDPARIAKPSELFLAAVAAISFAAIMMMTMLTFLFLLMARMMTLWILIVLSPFAFVLNVLPQTQKYAGQWWTEFGGNVVAGPIVAFFLWLSFVTVGGGEAHSNITAPANNSVTRTEQPGASADPKETSTGITDIMSWANMANFAIAIGMLLAGAKMAQQLGAAGGAMMGKAGEFGKKVAMAASGITAARWAGRGVAAGAKKAGKWGLMNVPLVGGKSWQRRGKAIQIGAARVGEKWNKAIGGKEAGWLGKRFQIGRHAKVMEEREKQLKSRVSRMANATNVEDLKRQTDKLEGEDELRKASSEAKRKGFRAEAGKAYLQTPEGAKYMEKMKVAEEKEADLEKVKTDLETAYAKGGGGMYLAEAKAKAEKAKLELGTAQKEAAHFAEGVVGLPAARAEAKQAEELIEAKRATELLKELAKLLKTPAGATKAGEIYKTRAVGDTLKEESELDVVEQVAEARAKEYETGGNHLRAEATRKAAAAQRLKKDTELYGSLNYSERMAQEEILTDKIKTETDPDKLNKLRRQKAALRITNTTTDAESSRDGRYKALVANGFLAAEGGVLNDDNRLRAELSAQLGSDVRAGDEQKAINEWMASFDTPAQAQAAMRSLAGGFKQAAFGGDTSGVGLINEKVVNGKLELSWNSAADNSPGATKYFTERAQKVDKVTTMGNTVDRNGSQVLNGFSDRGVEAISAFYSGKDSRSLAGLPASVHASWNEAEVTMQNMESYLKALEAMKSTMKKDGFAAQMKSTDAFMKRLESAVNFDPRLTSRFAALSK